MLRNTTTDGAFRWIAAGPGIGGRPVAACAAVADAVF